MVPFVPPQRQTRHRSGCPVSISLEMLGDRWSMLIIRDLMVRGYKTFKDFEEAGEGIATNILADRLQKLEGRGNCNLRGPALRRPQEKLPAHRKRH